MDILETYREISAGLVETFISTSGQRMNDVMRVLTVISTIFIPLTFLAGVYGMNFDPSSSPWNMPELRWFWGYPVCVASMLATAVALLFYFKRKGWLSASWVPPKPIDAQSKSSK